MQHLEVSGAVRHIYIYVIRQLKVNPYIFFTSIHLFYFLFSYSPSFLLTFTETLSTSPSLSASSTSYFFLPSYPVFPRSYLSALTSEVSDLNMQGTDWIREGRRCIEWGETISHDRIHGLYHDLRVIQNKVSPTLQVSVYYLSRERRGNEKKKRKWKETCL